MNMNAYTNNCTYKMEKNIQEAMQQNFQQKVL